MRNIFISSTIPFILFNISYSILLHSSGSKDLINRATIYYINPSWKTLNGNSERKIAEVKRFKSEKDGLKLIIHGYVAHKDHIATSPIKNDWRDASSLDYLNSRSFVERIGQRLAKLLSTFIRVNNVPLQKVHIIGHSLGAHVAGVIGRYFNGSIGRITGLDPALPLFTLKSKDGLRSKDAQFVDVIHSDASILGDFTPRGHIDFYPNSGSAPQPGCESLDLITGSACSHYRAPLFFAESIQLPYNQPSVLCKLTSIVRGKVRKCLENTKSAHIAYLGELVDKRRRGYYYLKTNDMAPFGLGRNSKNFVESFQNSTI
ncbi:hypothetical protein ACFFRR_009789 [Megaselia abdita]